MRRDGIPFALYFCDSADVRFGGEHKFIVKDPFGFFVHSRRGVKRNDLI
jgi:hypothetical protein